MIISNREKVLFCNRKGDKKIISLYFKKRKCRSNRNIQQIIGKKSLLYRIMVYHRSIFKCLLLKPYGVPAIRQYNYKR